MIWHKGDPVEYTSTCSDHVFRGKVEGFYGSDGSMAMCTDQTGRRSRPVAVKRLRRPTVTHWYTGKVA